LTAYLIANLKVTDPAAYEAYRAAAPRIIEKYGGRYLVRGGAVDVLEGDWTLPRLVILAFASPAQARRFYDSPEYQEILPLRRATAEGTVIIVEGTGSAG